jgi:hypothetical protein
MFSRGSSQEGKSISFAEVFPKELEVVEKARGKRQAPKRSLPLSQDLIGLAFSGCGIRSATFNLGVIQALARHNLLRLVDYLSTVSGGGYIGSWLSSWAYYVGQQPNSSENQIGEIEYILNSTPRNIGDLSEPRQIHFLRKYSNYLTPRLGMLSGDTLAFVATYLRNLLLNQMILISVLLSILLIPQALGLLFREPVSSLGLWTVGGAGCVILIFALALIVKNMNSATPDSSHTVIRWIVVPLFVFSVLVSYVMWKIEWKGIFSRFTARDGVPGEVWLVLGIAAVYAAIWGLAACFTVQDHEDTPYLRWAPALWALPTGIIAGLAVLLLFWIMATWRNEEATGVWYLITFGIPLVTLTVLMVGVFHLGLIGRTFQDALREWWARLGGEVLGIAACWFLLSVVTRFVPIWLDLVEDFIFHSNAKLIWRGLSALGITGGVAGWISATLKGLADARSSKTGPRSGAGGQDNGNSSNQKTAHLAARIAPPIFAAGLLIALSRALYYLVPVTHGGSRGGEDLITSWYGVAALCLALFGISRFFGYRVDVNEFSLHNAYRNRLVRCYLGATHEGRHPQPFTGFDDNDNIFLASLVDLGVPFHILNATLNVVKGKELALQARKARSFTFTPLYSGFDYSEEESVSKMPDSIEAPDRQATNDPEVSKPGSYRLTRNCSFRSLYPGARLGTAMAISGAAVSPNMGHYTSGAVSFLLAIFSVRLGWWLGNPRIKREWESAYPRSSWRALLNELTGNTTDDRKEVYLSDGGHFDNLGVYELIRRRCRVIIASDAGADPSRACGDLASVIEKCRVDFGTEITMQGLEEICATSTPVFPCKEALLISKSPFALGTISYPDATKGQFIYIKPSLNAQLPQDVLAYALQSNAFPHQSTMDQFFDESQFESYRALGFACASAAMSAISDAVHI